MATFHGQTVDVYETFESALGASWTATNPDTNITLAAGAAFAGAQGLQIDMNGATAGADVAHERYDTGAERTNLTIGFWFKGTAFTAATVDAVIGTWAASTPGTQNLRIYYRKAAGVYGLGIRGTAFSTNIAVSTDTWYWVVVNGVKNTTSTLRVYDTNHAQVGSDVTATANNNVCQYVFLGYTTAAVDEDRLLAWDEFILDWTNHAFPLLGWDTFVYTQLERTHRGMLRGCLM